MAKADLLVSIGRAGASADRAKLRSTVEALMADERARSHHGIAERLERALQLVRSRPRPDAVQRSGEWPGRYPRSHAAAAPGGSDPSLPVRRGGEQLVDEGER